MATNSSKYKLTGVNGSEIQISLNGPTGPTGPANVLEIGNVTTAETGVPAAASITGSSPSQLLHLTLPKGNTGTAATIAVGTTITGAAGSSASVTNGGSSSAAVFNFTIPKGDKGNTGTLSLGTVATGNAGTDVIITNTGTPEAGEFNFTIPRGDTGLTGPANQLSVNPTVTGAAGTDASVVISGAAPSQTLSFTIPRGNTGLTGPIGPANQLSVNPTVTGAAGTDASVVISGAAPSQTLSFTIPRGNTGATGSSGAVSLLTGFASAAGTVAETDTILAAVGKLDGNIALRATTASLYPYIGGKLLTYLDEEEAIADPLISAGDIYRKSAGGVDYVNPDNVPSLDLRFATDKTLTARRGPTPTFSRASSGTFVNANGLIVGKTAGTTSSITPNTQAIGSQVTVTVASGSVVGWVVGQAISLIVDTDGQDDPDSTELWLLGNIVSSTDTTLVFTVTSRTAQAGSATSWTLGYRGPRFDHDPVTLACKGLLIEEGRTNLSRYSGSIVGGSGWNTVGVTSTVSGIAPNGDSSNLVSETTISSDHVAINTGGLGAVPNETSVVSGTTYTASIFVKKAPASIDWIQVSIGAAGFGTSQFANFNISNGSYGNFAGLATGSVPRIEAFPNGWYRCSVTVTANATVSNSAGTLLAFINNTNGTTRLPTYLGSDANSVFAWGAQLEAGSFPTSYIPTTTGTLARSADVCSITGGAFSGLYNQSEGTLLLSADEFRRGTSFLPLLAISNSAGFSANRISIVSYGAKTGNAAPLEFLVTSGGTVQYSAIQTSIPSNFKAALAYKLDDARAALNGALAAADAPPSVSPIGANTLIIGGGGIYISSVRYFRKRLSNEKLQALTV
jgi:membrane protein YqaA with SNARE-associated domain